MCTASIESSDCFWEELILAFFSIGKTTLCIFSVTSNRRSKQCGQKQHDYYLDVQVDLRGWGSLSNTRIRIALSTFKQWAVRRSTRVLSTGHLHSNVLPQDLLI